LEKKTKFEVVPIADVLQKARPIKDGEPAGDRFAASPSPKGRLIENAPFDMSKGRGQVMAKRIFVVDDEKIIADSLSAILKKSGFDASAFYDAETALSACEIAVPECIISDVTMPGMNGIDLAMQIRERFPACTILLFSGQAATFDLLATARSRGHDFELLSKPVHPKDLLARLMTGSANPAKDGLLTTSA
jgi:CheY-like chemotaxis protein